MKIIERRMWGQYVFCTDCQSQLEIDNRDVKWGDFGVSYADDHDWHCYIVCPVCKTENKVDPPQFVRDEAMAHKRRR